MTAHALPLRPKPFFGMEAETAGDARFTTDLTMDLQTTGPCRLHAVQLETIERIFEGYGRWEGARAAIDGARGAAGRRAAFGGEVSESIALAFASDLFVAFAVERSWRSVDVDDLVRTLGAVLGMPSELVESELLRTALQAPQLLELPPAVAVEAQLATIVALSPAIEASLWSRDAQGRPHCLVHIGDTTSTRRVRAVAAAALEGQSADSGARGMIIGAPVSCWEVPSGALVVRVRGRLGASLMLADAAAAVRPILERELLLQRSSAREHSLVRACETRMARLAFDLHDGPLQHVAALGADVRLLRRQVAAREGANDGSIASRFEDLDARVFELNRVLRELAHSLEPVSLVRRPLEDVIEDEAAAFRDRTGVDVTTGITGDVATMTPSQKIALIRVVQEALTNIREHAAPTSVRISVRGSATSIDALIEDDGEGFEVTRTLQDAARRGRLGLVGSSERIRLLGGTFNVRSSQGGPTIVALSLPRWQPLRTQRQSPLEATF